LEEKGERRRKGDATNDVGNVPALGEEERVSLNKDW